MGTAVTFFEKNCDVLNMNGYQWFGNYRQELHKMQYAALEEWGF